MKALNLAIGQLSDPRLRRVIWLSIGLTIVVFILIGMAMNWLIGLLAGVDLVGWLEPMQWLVDWMSDEASWFFAALGTVLLAWFFLPAISSLVTAFFLDEVIEAVEARHYTDLPETPGQPFVPMMTTSLKFTAVEIGINLLALPFYFLALFTGFLAPILFYGINGYLMSREYFEMVGFHRLGEAETRELRRAHSFRLFWHGVVMAFLTTIPVVNLVAPVMNAALMTHVFEKIRREAGYPALSPELNR